ncbi:PAAR domain-containing protein [Variovorax ginsengisoli]|uniref:Zn-binding protein involved in type VI secretion n=1 Tax=Variovorax ginsengisoli TaxID=363844 RepID=A0ABT9S733_9BURK|nr:PAAR domain-containing protein [Variovorax ginsengisoli]MDP9900173.1 putative Zn-binding protein involved in type VI secretion [Variovorax ginsengisoli]
MATRANLYGKSQVVLGDRTSHGGVVISGSATSSWHGIPVARKKDRVYCPKCAPHFFEIAEGLGNCTDTDAALPLATEGHLTTCGAALIAESAPSRLLLEVLHFSNGRGFDDRYILRDESGQPMPYTYYAAKKLDNSIEYGTTDEAGHTHIFLTGEEESSIIFYIAG